MIYLTQFKDYNHAIKIGIEVLWEWKIEKIILTS